MKKPFLFLLITVLFSGCVVDNATFAPAKTPEATPPSSITPEPVQTTPEATAAISGEAQLEDRVQSPLENTSAAKEVDYREYVDWFRNYNLNIRAYEPEEYVCGQYTADMIQASEKAGFHAYFAAVIFTDGTGHALVSFKSTWTGFTSWYFFEPQTNKLMTPDTLDQALNRNMGKKVKEVSIYGYFDDAEDKDPTSWRFAYLLFHREY